MYLALGANAGIGVAKLAGGLISGSSAMLAEAAHSAADTTNQLLLLASLNLAERPPGEEHPFGYEGVHRILGGGSEEGSVGIAFAVLAIGIVLEGSSLIRAMCQTDKEARRRRRSFTRELSVTRDPTTKTVVFEDTAAVIGLLLAAAGLGLMQLTGSVFWDGAASIAIGVLLAAVAFTMGRHTKGLLIGESAQPEERRALIRVFEEHSGVKSVEELLTMALGPASPLVAARLDFVPELDSDEVEEVADELARQLRDAVPEVTEVFLDPTRRIRPA